MPNMVDIIKQVALNAVRSTKPAEIMFGEVESISPLWSLPTAILMRCQVRLTRPINMSILAERKS